MRRPARIFGLGTPSCQESLRRGPRTSAQCAAPSVLPALPRRQNLRQADTATTGPLLAPTIQLLTAVSSYNDTLTTAVCMSTVVLRALFRAWLLLSGTAAWAAGAAEAGSAPNPPCSGLACKAGADQVLSFTGVVWVSE